jgi:Zn-dependent peptidase ImmA (M78 family)
MITEQIECAAETILRKLNITTVPVPVEEIATKNGVKISRAPSREFSGILIRKQGSALIGISSSEPNVRQRFTVAHELGHYFLHPRKDAFVDYIHYRDNSRSSSRDPQERQANMFAAALVMPRKLLEKDLRLATKGGFDDDDVATLAAKYQVSSEAMKIRLINLRLLAAAKLVASKR